MNGGGRRLNGSGRHLNLIKKNLSAIVLEIKGMPGKKGKNRYGLSKASYASALLQN